MEAQWGLQDGQWGRQVAAGGSQTKENVGDLVVGMVVLGGPYMSFGQSIAPRSLVAP